MSNRNKRKSTLEIKETPKRNKMDTNEVKEKSETPELVANASSSSERTTPYQTESSFSDIEEFKPLFTSSPDSPKKIIKSHCVPVEQFEHVSGRFSMHGCQSKYMISREEVIRRIAAPEKLNSSAISALLRRCKVKDCGEDLRLKMAQYGIDMDFSRRKGSLITTITGISESEMHDLASDLDELATHLFPTRTIADCIIEDAKTTEERDQIVEEAEDFMNVMARLVVEMGSSQPPLTGIKERSSDNDEFHEKFKEYSSVSHGFGPLNYHTWAQQFLMIGKHLSDFIPLKEESLDGDG